MTLAPMKSSTARSSALATRLLVTTLRVIRVRLAGSARPPHHAHLAEHPSDGALFVDEFGTR